MKRTKFVTTVIALSLLGAAKTSIACSCAEIEKGNVRKPEYIFIGYTENSKGWFQFWPKEENYKFKVVESIKGNLDTHTIVQAKTNTMACGIRYSSNVQYIIFGNKVNGVIRSGACGSFPIKSTRGQRLILLLKENHGIK